MGSVVIGHRMGVGVRLGGSAQKSAVSLGRASRANGPTYNRSGVAHLGNHLGNREPVTVKSVP